MNKSWHFSPPRSSHLVPKSYFFQLISVPGIYPLHSYCHHFSSGQHYPHPKLYNLSLLLQFYFTQWILYHRQNNLKLQKWLCWWIPIPLKIKPIFFKRLLNSPVIGSWLTLLSSSLPTVILYGLTILYLAYLEDDLFHIFSVFIVFP